MMDFSKNKASTGIHILLAEDNDINQMVVADILERAGICVDIAENGLEAIEAVKKKRYDAVLMDLQMPVMDGYESTKAIRKWESKRMKAEGGRRRAEGELKADNRIGIKNSAFHIPNSEFKSIPIIAMTGHAMCEDRENHPVSCMNGYVSKPIDQNALFDALRKHLSTSKRPFLPREIKSDPGPAAETKHRGFCPVLDIDEGLLRFGGNWSRYVTTLEKFCRTQKNVSNIFKDLVRKEDFQAVRNRTHALKGVAANFSAIQLGKAAQSLEDASGSKDKSRILRRISALEQALGTVAATVEKIRQPESAPIETPVWDRSVCSQPSGLLSKFDHSLSKFDLATSESCLKELKARNVSIDYNSVLKNLEEQILSYDFNGARKTLRSLKETLDI